MMGDNASARKSYEEFLSVWKDADTDIPIYREAKADTLGWKNRQLQTDSSLRIKSGSLEYA